MAQLLTKADLEASMERLDTRVETLVRQLTVRFGIMLAVGFGALAAFLKLT
jgi:hypothetical protein